MSDVVVRIAARGDGVTSSGRHIPFGVPGDVVDAEGALTPGPDHVTPPCGHFPQCGGCQLQHLSDRAYAAYCGERARGALAQHGLDTDIRQALLSPPRSRRRAALRVIKSGGRVMLGFNERGSNKVVDLVECHVLCNELFALLHPLRALLGRLEGRTGEVYLTLVDQGVDLLLRGFAAKGLEAVEALPTFGERHRLARLSLDEGFGSEVRFEPVPATITLSGAAVPLPIGAFLQATREGEAALVSAVREAVGGSRATADLFAGIGTFALALEGSRLAAEASRDAVLALKRVAPGIAAEHRDLYRRPLASEELSRFDAVVLDPPRAGAEEQVRELAAARVSRVAYVSCNPATFARDARLLIDASYRLQWVQPVGQFLWSTHVELAAAFAR